MFLGQHLCSLDAKNRLSIPAKFRAALSDGVFVTQGFERNLLLLTGGAFQEIARHAMSLNMTDPLARLLLRLILGNAGELELKENGLVALPAPLTDFAGLREQAVLVGQGDYCELWSPDQWTQQEAQLRNAESNAQRFAVLTVATRRAGG